MIALYSRVSTAEQAREGYSIGEQVERLTAYCKSRGWNKYKHYTDAGFSGGNMERPALQDMLSAIRAGEVDTVVVYKLDRLSRSQRDMLSMIEDIFQPNGVDFISMSESFDTGSAFGMATIGMMSCFAQLERSQIQERMAIGREGRAKEGKWHGSGSYPIGYDYKNGELVINEYEAMQIREVFKMFLEGHALSEIADTIHENKWTHKSGVWWLTTVRRVLQNPIYIGYIRYHGKLMQGIHEPIIDKDTFDRVQARLEKPHKKASKRRPISESYLVGKIYCSRCGKRYTHQRTLSGHEGSKKRISYYTCLGRCQPKNYGIKKCDNVIYRCDYIDGMILDEIRGLQLEEIEEYREEQHEPDRVSALKKELAKIDKQRSRLIDLFTLGSFDTEELQMKADTLNARREALEEQIAAASTEKRSMQEITVMFRTIADVIDKGTPEQIRALIDALLDHIDIDGEDITIYWDFD